MNVRKRLLDETSLNLGNGWSTFENCWGIPTFKVIDSLVDFLIIERVKDLIIFGEEDELRKQKG